MKAAAEFLQQLFQILLLILGITLFFSQCRSLVALYRYLSDELMKNEILYQTGEIGGGAIHRVSREELMIILMTTPDYDMEIDGVSYAKDAYAFHVARLPKQPESYTRTYIRDNLGNIVKVVYHSQKLVDTE